MADKLVLTFSGEGDLDALADDLKQLIGDAAARRGLQLQDTECVPHFSPGFDEEASNDQQLDSEGLWARMVYPSPAPRQK
jgi:hypothetical protein